MYGADDLVQNLLYRLASLPARRPRFQLAANQGTLLQLTNQPSWSRKVLLGGTNERVGESCVRVACCVLLARLGECWRLTYFLEVSGHGI